MGDLLSSDRGIPYIATTAREPIPFEVIRSIRTNFEKSLKHKLVLIYTCLKLAAAHGEVE